MSKLERKKTFGEMLGRLEEITSKLEGGDLAIDEALGLYKEGVTLHDLCKKKLDEAELVLEDVGR